MGYYRAGFTDITGVDNRRQKNYPFRFVLADALECLEEHGHEYDVIHASPPCQAYSVTKSIHKNKHVDLIGITRELLVQTGKIYIIENVEGAPLRNYVRLCGSMFPKIKVYRHRLFECNIEINGLLPPCNHSFSLPASKGEYHTLSEKDFITCVGHNFSAEDGRKAMGIDWMTRDEISQAIPPAYTEWIGKRILEAINHESATGLADAQT